MARRRPWHLVQDVLLAAVVTAAALAEVWVPFESAQGDGSPVVSTVVIVLSGFLLALRRSHPLALVGIPAAWVVAGFATAGDVQILFFGQLVPIYLALYSAVRHARLQVALVVCGAVLGAVLLADLVVPELQELSELLFHWGVLLAVLGIGVGLRVSERRAVDAALRASVAESESREAVARAAADERARISRELHDLLGHSVSVMVVQAGAAAQAVDDDPEFVRRALESIRTTGTQSLDEVRRVVSLLRESDGGGLAPQPGLDGLPALVAQTQADGIDVTLTESGTRQGLSPGQELAAYRIVQEALTNIRKHARCSSAHVRLGYTTPTHGGATSVEVLVTDDGPGLVAAGAGHGLVGMRERVAAYGGTLEAGPTAQGWRVHATVPAGSAS